MKSSHATKSTLATLIASIWLAGCAARVTVEDVTPPGGRIEMHESSLTGSLASQAPTPMQAQRLLIDEPLRGGGNGGAWSDSIAATARLLQPEALRQGAISIDRPSEDRLSVRIALNSAFSGHAAQPNPALAPFFAKLATSMKQYADLCSTLAENRAASGRKSTAMRPFPRAAAVRRALIERGVDSGRLAIELEPPVATRDGTLRLPSEIASDGNITMSLYRCEA